jgi:hypothetical protein
MQYTLPAPELPRLVQPRPSDGTGGFRVDFSKIAAAQEIPQLDVKSFTAAAAARGDIGAGLTGLSDGLFKIHAQMAESANRKAVDDAAIAIQTAEKEIGRRIGGERDPQNWQRIFDEESAKWESDFLKGRKFSRSAQEAIGHQFKMWRLRGSTRAAHLGLRKQLQDETDGLEGARVAAAEAGDYDTAHQYTNTMEARGLIGKDTAGRQRGHTETVKARKVSADAIEGAVQAAHQDPEGTAQAVLSPEFGMHLAGEVVSTIRNAVLGIQAVAFNVVQTELLEAVLNGADRHQKPVRTKEDVARVAGNRLRPDELTAAQSALLDFQSMARKSMMAHPQAQDAQFGSLQMRVWQFDREQLGGVNAAPARKEYREILNGAVWLQPDLRDTIVTQIKGKWLAEPPKTSRRVTDYLDWRYQTMFPRGGFGPTTKEVVLKPGDPGFARGGKNRSMVVDDELLRQAHIKLAQTKMEMDRWITAKEKKGELVGVKEADVALQDAIAGTLTYAEGAQALGRTAPGAAPPPEQPRPSLEDLRRIQARLQQQQPQQQPSPSPSPAGTEKPAPASTPAPSDDKEKEDDPPGADGSSSIDGGARPQK